MKFLQIWPAEWKQDPWVCFTFLKRLSNIADIWIRSTDLNKTDSNNRIVASAMSFSTYLRLHFLETLRIWWECTWIQQFGYTLHRSNLIDLLELRSCILSLLIKILFLVGGSILMLHHLSGVHLMFAILLCTHSCTSPQAVRRLVISSYWPISSATMFLDSSSLFVEYEQCV